MTKADTTSHGRFSFNNHLIPINSTPLLSSTIHRLIVPGLKQSGTACITVVTVVLVVLYVASQVVGLVLPLYVLVLVLPPLSPSLPLSLSL